MPYCPVCRYEYTAGMITCPDCDAELVAELPPDERDAAAKEYVVPVFVAKDRTEAQIVKGVLESAGIPAYLTPGVAPYGAPKVVDAIGRLGQQTIMVPESRADEAGEVIEQALEAGRYDISESD